MFAPACRVSSRRPSWCTRSSPPSPPWPRWKSDAWRTWRRQPRADCYKYNIFYRLGILFFHWFFVLSLVPVCVEPDPADAALPTRRVLLQTGKLLVVLKPGRKFIINLFPVKWFFFIIYVYIFMSISESKFWAELFFVVECLHAWKYLKLRMYSVLLETLPLFSD